MWSDVYNNDNAITAVVNGDIRDDNLSASAALTESKFAAGATGLAKGSFSAYRAAAVSLADTAVVVFDTESWDTSNWFDETTGRFTPQIAGYWRVNAIVAKNAVLSASDKYWSIAIRLAGTTVITGGLQSYNATFAPRASATGIIQCNGSTDYIDVILGHNETGSVAVLPGAADTFFQGELIGRS